MIRAIVTGATGMVGEGVLHEALLDPGVEKVLVAGRRSCGVTHPKMKELIIPDFFDLSEVQEEFSGYNACFFCLGVSSLNMTEKDYTRITHDLTLKFALALSERNPDMTFCYVSGAGTDSTEKGKTMWARVKGKTENDLMKLPFRSVFAFRPGFMRATPGLKNTLKFYKYIGWLYKPGRALFPGFVCTLAEVGRAMINAALLHNRRMIVNTRDIVRLASEASRSS